MCADMGMPAVAITDTNSLFAALEFSVTAQGAGIQPIVGCQVDMQMPHDDPSGRTLPPKPAPIVLLSQREEGYENLMKLSSCLYVDNGGQVPQVTLDELTERSDGLICLTGGPDGPMGRMMRDGQHAAAQAMMTR
eukprot:CAMPEP_0184411848 /NCGR_PEP_ID=MMETSP0738-20130409/6000_1 /TAXON_ID=385413 /ORGANISM="Thalassiosira miniscula, Strain CCMP1093" /LENGTH=134 /DNA_ID=CAMNT_0026770183 /DNA_START=408 /DNA_END=808 /DNA_ORIENTATION=-